MGLRDDIAGLSDKIQATLFCISRVLNLPYFFSALFSSYSPLALHFTPLVIPQAKWGGRHFASDVLPIGAKSPNKSSSSIKAYNFC
jgi:hypothetical protein